MNTPKRQSAIQRAGQSAYASIEWDADDVRMLRPRWDDARANAFLAAVEGQLAAATLAAGWAALSAMIAEHERAKNQNGNHHEQ